MPFKNTQKQREYMKKYRTPYMREYRRFKKQQMDQLKKAIEEELSERGSIAQEIIDKNIEGAIKCAEAVR